MSCLGYSRASTGLCRPLEFSMLVGGKRALGAVFGMGAAFEMRSTGGEVVMHVTEVTCRVAPARAFAFLGDGRALGSWALGSLKTEEVGAGVFRGHSLFDDQPAYIRPECLATEMRVVYHVGSSPSALTPRIEADVIEDVADASSCRVVLRAERPMGMSDERWNRLVRCHEVEVLLIQSRVEAYRAADPC